MERITKKSFFESLETKGNSHIDCIFNKKEGFFEKLCNLIKDIEPYEGTTWRKCIKKQSNALQFDGGSWIYKNDAGTKKYYQHNNIIIEETMYYSNFDECYLYTYLVYFVR